MNNIKSKKLKGFTLVELIIVIAILAILTAIAIPKYNESRQRSLVTAHNSNVKVLESAAMNYLANDGTETTWGNADDAKEYIADYPEVPKGIKGLENEGGKYYTVQINIDGDIIVTPGKIKEN